MGILKKYNEQSWRLAYYPEQNGLTFRGLSNGRFELDGRLLDSQLEDSFDQTSLDLENPSPLGGPINVPYNTKIGTEYKSFTTTQPYTPKRTYADSLQDARLIARATDPYK
jgi:hypothetical protein